MVDQAERFPAVPGVFNRCGSGYHHGDLARIEVSPSVLAQFTETARCREVVEHLKSIGFKYVALDLEGFRSGSMNAVLPPESLRILAQKSS